MIFREATCTIMYMYIIGTCEDIFFQVSKRDQWPDRGWNVWPWCLWLNDRSTSLHQRIVMTRIRDAQWLVGFCAVIIRTILYMSTYAHMCWCVIDFEILLYWNILRGIIYFLFHSVIFWGVEFFFSFKFHWK